MHNWFSNCFLKYKGDFQTLEWNVGLLNKSNERLIVEALNLYDLVYTNALISSELSKRLAYAESIVTTEIWYWETNILVNVSNELNLLNLSKEMESLKIKKDSLQGELTW